MIDFACCQKLKSLPRLTAELFSLYWTRVGNDRCLCQLLSYSSLYIGVCC